MPEFGEEAILTVDRRANHKASALALTRERCKRPQGHARKRILHRWNHAVLYFPRLGKEREVSRGFLLTASVPITSVINCTVADRLRICQVLRQIDSLSRGVVCRLAVTTLLIDANTVCGLKSDRSQTGVERACGSAGTQSPPE